MNRYLLTKWPKFFLKLLPLLQLPQIWPWNIEVFSGCKQNVLPCIFLNAVCWISWGCSLILWIIFKMCSCWLWNLLFLLISNQQVAYTFMIKFIKLWSFVVSLKHMTLMAKVNHLAWFKGPIFQEAYLESTLPLEIPTVYSYKSLWLQLRSCILSIFKIESRVMIFGVNHGNPLSIISPGGHWML